MLLSVYAFLLHNLSVCKYCLLFIDLFFAGNEISDASNLRLPDSLLDLTILSNQLTSIDVSANNALTDFTVVDNPLNYILVNEMQLNAIPTDWEKDEMDSYSLDCQ